MKAESGKGGRKREEKLSSRSVSLCYPPPLPLPSSPGRCRTSERATLLGRARLFSLFQVPLTLAAAFEDQPEGSAEERERWGDGGKEKKKSQGRRRTGERGETGGGRAGERRRREAEEVRLGAAELKSGHILLSFFKFFFLKKQKKPQKLES